MPLGRLFKGLFTDETKVVDVQPTKEKTKDTKDSNAPIQSTRDSFSILFGSKYSSSLTDKEIYKAYKGNEWVRASVDKIAREVVKYNLKVEPKNKENFSEETERHVEEVQKLLDNPNKRVESFEAIRRKYLKDVLIYDAGALEVVYEEGEKYQQRKKLKNIINKLTKLYIKSKNKNDKELEKKKQKLEKKKKELKKELKQTNGRKPIELYDVKGSNIVVNVDRKGNYKDDRQAYFLLDESSSTNEPAAVFGKDELCYMISNPIAGSIYGLSPIETIYRTVEMDNKAVDLNKRRLENDGMISGVLSLPGISSKKLKRNKKFWKNQARQGGARLIITSSDKASFTSVAETHEEMQFMDYQRWGVTKIMAVYGMQPLVLGIVTRNTGKLNSAQQRRQFKADAILPLLTLEKHELNSVIVKEGFGYDDVEIVHKTPEQELAPEERTERARVAGNLGVLTIDEVRSLLGFNKLAGGEGEEIASPNPMERSIEPRERNLRDKLNELIEKGETEKVSNLLEEYQNLL